MERLILWQSLCALTTAACAQPSAATLEQVLAQMDGTHLADRETAERACVSMPGVTIAQIEELAGREDLSPEQVYRLRQAARRIFERSPKGGMGVQFQALSGKGVTIGETIEGFHASEVLEPLDTIILCNGQRMREQDQLRWTILSHDPGDVLSLEVDRAGTVLTLEVRLGSYEELTRADPLDPIDLANAFALRWARTVEDPLERMTPIGAGTSVEDWAQVEAGEIESDRLPQWPLTRDAAPRMVAFGGRPRSALSIRQALSDFSGPVDAGEFSRGQVSTVAGIIDQMRALTRQRIVVDQRAQTLERHADMVADPARQQQLIEMRDAALEEIIIIDAELSALREALRIIREQGGE